LIGNDQNDIDLGFLRFLMSNQV